MIAKEGLDDKLRTNDTNTIKYNLGKRRRGREEEYLEGKIESDGRVVAKNTAAIASPKRENAFFSNRTDDTIDHALESRTSTPKNGQVALLGLQQELGSLDWGHDRVHNPAHHRPGHEIALEVVQPIVRP